MAARRCRFSQLAAATVAMTLAQAAHAVIFNSTGDASFNTTAPTGPLANSGWQYQFDYGFVSGTAIAPNHIIMATHTAPIAGQSFSYRGVSYTTTSTADYGDLRILGVDKEILSYAPLYAETDDDETGSNVVMMGRGTQRGDELVVGSEAKGWLWGPSDYVRRWGENIVTATADFEEIGDERLLRMDFNRSGPGYAGVNEGHMSSGDSGGGMFIQVDGQWKLAGVNYGVTGPFGLTETSDTFVAALYDMGGLYDRADEDNPALIDDEAEDIPSSFYVSRISAAQSWIQSTIYLPPTWNVNANGDWATAGSWANGGVPDGEGARADFRTAINAPRTVTLNTARTLGSIYFDSLSPYTISGSGSLTFDAAPTLSAKINVVSGSHTIATPVSMVDATIANVLPGAALTVSGAVSISASLEKIGGGTLSVKHARGGSLTVTEGVLSVLSNGGADGTSQVSSLSVASGAKLDLANNDLATETPVGTWGGSSYTGLIGRIDSAQASGTWSGDGITTSSFITGRTGLGIGRAGEVLSLSAGQTTLWSGRTVGAGTTLIAYTYQGDLNLDGVITADDYAYIDLYSNIANSTGYTHGDINYDGAINADDYALIDINFILGGPDLIDNAARPVLLAAVPEPTGVLAVALIGGAALLRRRRNFHA